MSAILEVTTSVAKASASIYQRSTTFDATTIGSLLSDARVSFAGCEICRWSSNVHFHKYGDLDVSAFAMISPEASAASTNLNFVDSLAGITSGSESGVSEGF